ncbi:MAG: hypothetical protein IJG87_11440 [Ruminococcus sp.]|nr:hypothetical protein [Ruminococcus sp.]
MKAKSKPPIAVIAAAALLCLVMVSMSMASGMFARYTVKASSPDDDSDARTAAFAVSAEAPTESPVTIIPDGTDDNGKAVYTVRVKNDSEVAVRYEAVVNFTGEHAAENKEKFDNSDDQLTFTGELAPMEEKDETLTLDMSAYFDENDRYATFSNDDISGSKGKAPFEVNVKFTQID